MKITNNGGILMEQLIEKSRKKLEYDKVIARLAEQTSFAISREKALLCSCLKSSRRKIAIVPIHFQ